jgi:hypothetical protein
MGTRQSMAAGAEAGAVGSAAGAVGAAGVATWVATKGGAEAVGPNNYKDTKP